MKSYRTFLRDLGSELLDAIGVAENLEWHHLPLDTEEWKCYNRLCTWITEIADRLIWYDDVKTNAKTGRPRYTQAQAVLDRHISFRGRFRSGAGQQRLDVDPESIRQTRANPGSHDSEPDDPA